jgi:hypothetical protein
VVVLAMSTLSDQVVGISARARLGSGGLQYASRVMRSARMRVRLPACFITGVEFWGGDHGPEEGFGIVLLCLFPFLEDLRSMG